MSTRHETSYDLAHEAAWRAGWDADDLTLEFDGDCVFYHRKDPLWKRWEDQSQRQTNKVLSALLIGPKHGVVTREDNPYKTCARYRRNVQGVSSSESASDDAFKREHVVFHVESDDLLKTREQVLFELAHPASDAHGRIPAEHAEAILLYCGAAIPVNQKDQVRKNLDCSGQGATIYDVNRVMEQYGTTKEGLVAGLEAVRSEDVTVGSLLACLTIYGDTPLDEDMAKIVIDNVLKMKNKNATDVANEFVAGGTKAWLAEQLDVAEEDIPDKIE